MPLVWKDESISNRGFNAIFWLAGIIIAVCFVAIIAYYVIIGVFIVKAAKTIDEQGLKSVVERVWEGKSPPSTTHLGDK